MPLLQYMFFLIKKNLYYILKTKYISTFVEMFDDYIYNTVTDRKNYKASLNM